MKSLKLITLLSILSLVSFSHVAFGMKRKRNERDTGKRAKKRQKLSDEERDDIWEKLIQKKDELEESGEREIKRRLASEVEEMELEDGAFGSLLEFADYQGDENMLKPLASAYAFKHQFSVDKGEWGNLNPNVAVEVGKQHYLENFYPIKIKNLDDKKMEELAKCELIKIFTRELTPEDLKKVSQIASRSPGKQSFENYSRFSDFKQVVKENFVEEKLKWYMKNSGKDSYVSFLRKKFDIIIPIYDCLGAKASSLHTSDINIVDLIEEGYINEEYNEIARKEALEGGYLDPKFLSRKLEYNEKKGRLEDPDFLFKNAEFINPELFKKFDKIKITKMLQTYIVNRATRGTFNGWFDLLKFNPYAIRIVIELVCEIADKKINQDKGSFRRFFNSIGEENLLKMALRIKYYKVYRRNIDQMNISDGILFFVIDRNLLSLRLSHIPEQGNWVASMFLYLAHYILGLSYDRKGKQIDLRIRPNQKALFCEALCCDTFLQRNIHILKI